MSEPFKILAEEVAYKVPGRYAVMLADLETPEGKHTQWSYIHWEKDIVVVLPITDDTTTSTSKKNGDSIARILCGRL